MIINVSTTTSSFDQARASSSLPFVLGKICILRKLNSTPGMYRSDDAWVWPCKETMC